MALTRIKGCAGQLVVWAVGLDRATDPEKLVVDMTSFSLSETAENPTFKVLGDCADQSSEGSTAYTLSGEGQVMTDSTSGQAVIENGKTFQWRFYLDKAAEADAFYEGNAIVNGRDFNATPDSNQTFSFSANGDGTLVKSNVP